MNSYTFSTVGAGEQDGGETGRNRNWFLPFCRGTGVDLGCGCAPIHERAIRIDRTEGHGHITGDVSSLPWFQDGVLDYVYASHVLEDFADWWPVLREWTRVIRVGGHLCIAVPDHQEFRKAVAAGQPDNGDHKHESYAGELTSYIKGIGGFEVMVDRLVRDYNILFIARRVC